MWFKNAKIYTVDFGEITDLLSDPGQLQNTLEHVKFSPCLAGELTSIGFSPVLGREGAFCFASGGSYFFKLTEENKILPSAVIKTALEERIDQKEAETGRRLQKKEKEDLKSALTGELTAKAFATRREILLWAHPGKRLCAVNVSSARRAEKALAMMRQAFPGFPAKVLQPRCAPEERLTSWVSEGSLPPKFVLGTDTVLKSPEDGSVIRASKEDLTSEEIIAHIGAGKSVTELQLTYDDAISVVLDSELCLKRIKFLDQYLEQNLPRKSKDAAADLQSLLILQGSELAELAPLILELFDCEY